MTNLRIALLVLLVAATAKAGETPAREAEAKRTTPWTAAELQKIP